MQNISDESNHSPELDHAVLLNLNVKYLLRDPSSKGSVDFSLVECSSGSTTKSIPNVIGFENIGRIG